MALLGDTNTHLWLVHATMNASLQLHACQALKEEMQAQSDAFIVTHEFTADGLHRL